MSGLIQRKPGGKDITIETQDIQRKNNGVLKLSKVKVSPHAKSAFFLGVRIGTGQTITELTFDKCKVLDRADLATTQELATALKIPDGVPEQWYGFALLKDDLPNPSGFETRFALEPFPLTGQFQLVPFVVAATLDSFAKGMYLVAVSVVTSPLDGPVELRRG